MGWLRWGGGAMVDQGDLVGPDGGLRVVRLVVLVDISPGPPNFGGVKKGKGGHVGQIGREELGVSSIFFIYF